MHLSLFTFDLCCIDLVWYFKIYHFFIYLTKCQMSSGPRVRFLVLKIIPGLLRQLAPFVTCMTIWSRISVIPGSFRLKFYLPDKPNTNSLYLSLIWIINTLLSTYMCSCYFFKNILCVDVYFSWERWDINLTM